MRQLFIALHLNEGNAYLAGKRKCPRCFTLADVDNKYFARSILDYLVKGPINNKRNARYSDHKITEKLPAKSKRAFADQVMFLYIHPHHVTEYQSAAHLISLSRVCNQPSQLPPDMSSTTGYSWANTPSCVPAIKLLLHVPKRRGATIPAEFLMSDYRPQIYVNQPNDPV
ncbi:hypothetical protein J6590_005218 [Homalodisca vitripennis]|nr:hypothetical protein J6590_005218 [Homalodisca vitripennis]